MNKPEPTKTELPAEDKKKRAIAKANLIIALDQAARENPHSFLAIHLEEMLEYAIPE